MSTAEGPAAAVGARELQWRTAAAAATAHAAANAALVATAAEDARAGKAKTRHLHARKLASLWVLGLEAQSRARDGDADGARARKARFRRQYVHELLRVTTIQGFLNFSFRDRHFSEHLVWVLAMVGAVIGSVYLCLWTWEQYEESPMVQSMERSYFNWKYKLPSAVVCPHDKWDASRVSEVANSLAAKNKSYDVQKLETFLKALVDSTSYGTLHFMNDFVDNHEGLPTDGWLDLALAVRLNFSAELLTEHTLQHTITEAGICAAINSEVLYTTAVNISERNKPPPTSEVVSSFCEMAVVAAGYFNSPFTLHVQGMDEVPNPAFWTLRLSRLAQRAVADLEISEIYATRRLSELSVEQRQCRYADDVPPGSPRTRYSLSICREECRARLAQRLCGCRPFFVTVPSIPACDFKGMACLYKNIEVLQWLRNRTSGEQLDCDCYPACNTYVYRVFSKNVFNFTQNLGAPSFAVNSLVFKKSRVKRDVLFTLIDLAAWFGGAVGLFLGVSVLSIIEVVYYFTLRLFFHPQRRNFL